MFRFGRDMRRHALAFGIPLAAAVAGACVPPADPAHGARPVANGTAGSAGVPARAEDTWLAEIGRGPGQTARVCARGSKDVVASALCSPKAESIRGLSELYQTLGFGDPRHRYVASTTLSLGLSGRIVSAANPRTFVFPDEKAPIPYERFVVTSFARGEQFVELAALDPVTLEYNFYLLSFEQQCNLTRCTPDDLLTAKIESNWTSFTLYADGDLEDTALDCLSCHRPFGAGTHKQLVMRQTAHPWLHWGDFKGVYENRICPDHPLVEPGRWITGDGLELMARLEGAKGHHAGVPVSELVASPSGERFSLFLTDAENTIRASGFPPDYPYAQVDFDSTMPLCERLATGSSPSWERAREDSMARGLPVPYYAHDAMDAMRRAELSADRRRFLGDRATAAPFDVAMSLLDADATVAIGFIPRKDDTAPQILRALCVRCHAETTDSRLRRAKFNAERFEPVEPEVAQAVRKRIHLPRSAPELMPPLRVGELPRWAIARIDEYLREHCSVPGGCAGD